MKTLLAVTLVLTAVVPALDLPSFEFENYDGRVITSAVFKGKTTIVVPTYAKCIFACPMITFLLTQFDRDLGAPENLQYLHVSIQPEEDTAEEILSHFDDHEIDAANDRRWLFVNGPEENIRQFLDHTGIEITRAPVDGGVVIEHTIRVWVVGPDGRTVTAFDTYFWNDEEMDHAIRTSRDRV
jgi:cytochrome oxidase Cu insertion factor (SCO1/SenC/PrrC family)